MRSGFDGIRNRLDRIRIAGSKGQKTKIKR